MKCSNFWLKWFKSKKEVKLIRYLVESSFSPLMHRSLRGLNVSPGNLAKVNYLPLNIFMYKQ